MMYIIILLANNRWTVPIDCNVIFMIIVAKGTCMTQSTVGAHALTTSVGPGVRQMVVVLRRRAAAGRRVQLAVRRP